MEKYNLQVSLLVRVLPYIAKESCFALKGGTAINLFVRNMPRLSVDIDLTYIHIDPRSTAIDQINSALSRIKLSLEKDGIKMHQQKTKDNYVKLTCFYEGTSIKIEPNYVIRGTLFPVERMGICKKAQEIYGFAAIQVLHKTELYGSKICAALDRQHPRDLFDVQYLLDHEGLNSEIRKALLVFLLSHNRPINELLFPNFQDKLQEHQLEFEGLTEEEFTYDDYKKTFDRLVITVQNSFTQEDKAFIIGFHQLTPAWNLLGLQGVEALPAIQWKLQNLQKLKNENLSKYKAEVENIEKLLY